MATLVFTAIGSAIAGPVGGLVGSLIGQRADSVFFGATKRSEGPRIKELAVQTSSYGTQLPAIFGAMRVAGTVIWSTDLIEKRTTTSGGKSRPSSVNYSYSVSLAIALSSRPVARLGRIWAEGNLLRGDAGDFKVETGFRFHSGYADQVPDPLIASAEGGGQSPAYRDICYAVFENLQLADFGNRIPSMTFELFERDGSVLLADICATASEGVLSGTAEDAVTGYALQGSNIRTALSTLIETSAAQVRPDGENLELFTPDPEMIFDGDTREVLVQGDESERNFTDSRAGPRGHPSALSLRYYDQDRDYQAGVQSGGWSPKGIAEDQLDLPAVLRASDARQIVRNLQARRHAGRDRRHIALAIGPKTLSIGQAVGSTSIRISAIEHHAGYAIVDCSRWAFPRFTQAQPVDPGRHQPPPDLLPGQTVLKLIELPSVGSTAATAPILAVAAGGTEAGWRRAAISQRIDDSYLDAGSVVRPAAIGELLLPIGAHSAQLIDRASTMRIRVDTNAAPPEFNAGTPLHPDAPYVMIGDELMRVGSIEPQGGDVYAVRMLLRDCAKIGVATAHPAGSAAVFVDRDSLAFPDLRALTIGNVIEIAATAMGDDMAVTASRQVDGMAVLPCAPVHGRAQSRSDGSLVINWVWRARHDPGWLDWVDMPASESGLVFEVMVSSDSETLLNATTTEEALEIDAATLSAWPVGPGDQLDIALRQLGDFGRSLPYVFTLIL